MGAASSSIRDLPENEYLKKLSGREAISENDPFWNQLLSFSFTIPTNRNISPVPPRPVATQEQARNALRVDTLQL
uniref:Dymeclin n=1 Tax=Laticauda laticaudata TaxID=8630 RepID=A0A8C5RNY9_LATLA